MYNWIIRKHFSKQLHPFLPQRWAVAQTIRIRIRHFWCLANFADFLALANFTKAKIVIIEKKLKGEKKLYEVWKLKKEGKLSLVKPIVILGMLKA